MTEQMKKQLQELKKIRTMISKTEEIEVTGFQKPEALRYLTTVNQRITEIERQLGKSE